jgi:outer membrane biosynthesis protein TonB
MEPRHIIGAAIAVSVVGHLALAVCVYFADARPFDPSTSRDISVDIVTPQQVAEAARPAEQTPPEPDKTPDPFRLPELSDKPQPNDPASAATAKPPPAAPSQSTAQPPPQQQSSSAPQPATEQPPAQQSATAASASSAAPPAAQDPPPQQQAALQQPPSQPELPQTAVPRAEPDVTVKYGVMLGLPDGNGGSEAVARADIAPLDIAAFRQHLKSCATLPAAVSRGDKVRIVLRALLTPDGRLLTEPSLIEASASAKGPLLMQAAMQALQACQPYAMLPADRYKEWKVLDLAFTPQDFAG